MPKFVKPRVSGNVVPYPERGYTPLADAGDWVPDSLYWTRRLGAGDVVITKPPAVPAEASRRRSVNSEEK